MFYSLMLVIFLEAKIQLHNNDIGALCSLVLGVELILILKIKR